jgi:small conductance mechanosensitive channel
MTVLEQLQNYVLDPRLWISIGQMILKIMTIIVLAYIIRAIGNRIIDAIFTQKKNMPIRLTTTRRQQTLQSLLKNMLSYVLSFIVIVMILDLFNVPIGTLLAGAGIAGLAIGFGAQSLVKDILSGFFIIFEDQFSVGDYVNIADVEGTVEVVGFRTTKVLSWTGELNVIPNGNITQVINYSISNGLAIVDINLPYETDIIHAEKVIDEIIRDLPDKYDVFTGAPEVYGVQMLDLSNYVLRVIAETKPVYQWSGARIIRKEIKAQMYQQGIEIPSPRIVVYSRNEEESGENLKRGYHGGE